LLTIREIDLLAAKVNNARDVRNATMEIRGITAVNDGGMLGVIDC
jgi:hypothetical protein